MNKLVGSMMVLGALALAAPAHAFTLGIIAFQMSSETHARCANAASDEAKKKGWTVQVLNSSGSLPTHASQIEDMIQKKVDALIICMGKPVETDAQLAEAQKAGIPVITAVAGASPHTLFDVEVNEFEDGAVAAAYLLGKIDYRGNILEERFEQNVATRERDKVLDAMLSENQAVKVVGVHTMARTKTWQQDVRAGMQALILQNKGNIQGIWASFDGQAYIIDDILKAQGVKKGDVVLVSLDGGPETYRRIKDPDSLITATVAIPFEQIGRTAVDAVDKVVVHHVPKQQLASGPYILLNATLVDASNVDMVMKQP